MRFRATKNAKNKLNICPNAIQDEVHEYLIRVEADRILIPTTKWYAIPTKKAAIALGHFDVDKEPGVVWLTDLRWQRG